MRLLRSWTSARAQSTTGLSAVIYRHDEPQLAGWAWRSRRRCWLPAANVSPIRATSRTQPGRSQRFKQYEVIVPVIVDRVRQAQVVGALEPEWEARFEPKVYGFRPGRGCHDAIEAIYKVARGRNPSRRWVLDADLAAAFDRIDHHLLLSHLGTFPARDQVEQWLKAR